MNQCIRDQLLKGYPRNLQFAEGVDALPAALFPPQMAKNETHHSSNCVVDSPEDIRTVHVGRGVNVVTGVAHRLDMKHREERARIFRKEQDAGHCQQIVAQNRMFESTWPSERF